MMILAAILSALKLTPVETCEGVRVKRIIMDLARSGTTRVSWEAIIAAEVWLINSTNFRLAAPSFADMVRLMISTLATPALHGVRTSPQSNSSAGARFGEVQAEHGHPSEIRSTSLGSVSAFLVELVVLHGQSAIQDVTCALALAVAVVKLALCSEGNRTPLASPQVVDSAIEWLEAVGFPDMCVMCMYSIHRLWKDVSPCSAMVQKWVQRRLLPTAPSDEDLAQMCAEMGRREPPLQHSSGTSRGGAAAGKADVKAPTATLRGTGLASEAWRGLKRTALETRPTPRPGYASGAAVSPTSSAQAELPVDEAKNQEECSLEDLSTEAVSPQRWWEAVSGAMRSFDHVSSGEVLRPILQEASQDQRGPLLGEYEGRHQEKSRPGDGVGSNEQRQSL